MDILDIDEALKDVSYFFLEDKTHDVSNILQIWRNNNNCTSTHNSEQAFILNTKTFTRPQRETAQNLEAQFSPVPQSQIATTVPHQQQNCNNVNLEIGGLVTTMQKSFFQDETPPSSICSSMDVSMSGMNTSLITSANFTNISFLQSTRGDEPMSGLLFDSEKATEDGYTPNDINIPEVFEQKSVLNNTYPIGKEQIVPNGDDEFIGNITLDLVDSFVVTVQQVKDVKTVKPPILNITVSGKPVLEDTVWLKRFSVADVVNTTCDCSETKIQCRTPGNALKHTKHYEQSTPLQNTSYTASVRHKQSYTPSIKTADVNISPIVGTASNSTLNGTFVLTDIFKERINNETFNHSLESMELLENINPNGVFNKSLLGETSAVDASDEEAFDNLLDNIGKLELSEEQIKMRKSLDTIKQRFTYGVMDKSEVKENFLISSSEMVASGLSMNSSGGGNRVLNRTFNINIPIPEQIPSLQEEESTPQSEEPPITLAPMGVRKSTTAGKVLTGKESKINAIRTTASRMGGLQKFSAFTKATSKSFPNSSSNLGYGAAKQAPALTLAPMEVRKSTTAGNVLTGKQSKISRTLVTAFNATSTNLKQSNCKTESMSSASSRGSSTGKPLTNGISSMQLNETSIMPLQQTASIPKPPSLRPPSNIKRSDPPRPGGIAWR